MVQTLITTAIGLALLGTSALSLHHWDREAKDTGRLIAVPPPNLLRMATGGFQTSTADLLFLRFVDYWGMRLVNGRKFENLDPMLQEVTDLDPRMKVAFDIGSLALADDGKIDQMRTLLEKGAHAHPLDPWYPYHEGLLTFLFSDRYVTAGQDFERAARLPHASSSCLFFAARMFAKAGQKPLALATWRHILATDHSPEVRKVARRALSKIGVKHLPAG